MRLYFLKLYHNHKIKNLWNVRCLHLFMTSLEANLWPEPVTHNTVLSVNAKLLNLEDFSLWVIRNRMTILTYTGLSLNRLCYRRIFKLINDIPVYVSNLKVEKKMDHAYSNDLFHARKCTHECGVMRKYVTLFTVVVVVVFFNFQCILFLLQFLYIFIMIQWILTI